MWDAGLILVAEQQFVRRLDDAGVSMLVSNVGTHRIAIAKKRARNVSPMPFQMLCDGSQNYLNYLT